MASRRGPVPKPDDQRVRHRTSGPSSRTVVLTPFPAPDLPQDVLPAGQPWHPETVRWWRAWRESPLTAQLSEVEWHELLVAARLHHAIAHGDLRLSAELRRRVGAFGATAEDRARLHLTVTQAERAEEAAAQTRRPSSRDRYGTSRALRPVRNQEPGLAQDCQDDTRPEENTVDDPEGQDGA